MASRRYKIGKHKEYDHYFDLLKGNSPILNPTGSPPSAYSINLNDKSALRSHLLERRGAKGHPKLEDGYLWRGERGDKSVKTGSSLLLTVIL